MLYDGFAVQFLSVKLLVAGGTKVKGFPTHGSGVRVRFSLYTPQTESHRGWLDAQRCVTEERQGAD